MAEFDVVVAEKRFGKKGALGGFWAGDSCRIRVRKKESPEGLSMCPLSHSSASVKYKLAKSGGIFRAAVALNDSAGAAGQPSGVGKISTPVTFRVLGDGRELWKSPQALDAAGAVQDCTCDVTGVDVLELRVECPGSAVNAHAVWLEPRVLVP
jgi:endo-alpha-N-acetylgalactosaminidase